MSKMFSPPHPGLTLKDDVLPALGLTVSAAASQLGVSRHLLSRVLNCQAPITAGLAVRIEQWLGVEHGGRAELWVELQMNYDLWQARHVKLPRIPRAFLPKAA
jgi:addiction module HigA family antidote